MTATHNPPRSARKPRTRRRTLRLPRLGWWWAGIALIAFGVAKTWPVYTAITVALAAIGLITAARRPAWLQRAAHRIPTIDLHQRYLPSRGRRTLATFQRMNHVRFEQAIAELALEDPGVHTATRVGGANDHGADVLIHLHDGRRVMVQCKHHHPGNNVGSPVVQTVNGVYRDIHGCQQAAIVTTADFTPAATALNARLPHGIRLINGAALEAWANGGNPPW